MFCFYSKQMLTNVWLVMVDVIKYVQTHLEAIDATVLLGIHTTLMQKDVMVRVLCLDTYFYYSFCIKCSKYLSWSFIKR